MRIDHHAYRKATGVAGFGFLIQAAIGVALLVFGQLAGDTVFRFASFYVFGGLLVWLSLIVIFYQHAQERLEALEEDELAAERGGAGSVFGAGEHEKVAARRLRLMHRWLMPAVSVAVAAYLGLGAAWMIRALRRLDDPGASGAELLMTGQLGWAVAICLAFAAVCFIFSRFVAGMARQTAWQNLRGGAGFMVGNALVMGAAAVGIIFRFFDRDQVVLWVAWAIPFFMLLLVVEIGIHFVLNLYRPRIPGEVPRPAFDSRVLSLLAAPESIVRSVNEAVNYQFGFDITSSWGYQLLLRSVGGLFLFGIIVLIGLNMMVIVEPYQQAIRLRGGAIVGDVHGSGVLWKLPWPRETAEIYDTSRIKRLNLTAHRLEEPAVELWSQQVRMQTSLDPFITGGSPYSLIEAEISIDYRIRPDGLMEWLGFGSDRRRRGQSISMREEAIRALSLEAVSEHFGAMSLEEAMTSGGDALEDALRARIQQALDNERVRTGVEVVTVNIAGMRPPGEVARAWEDLAVARQQRRETVAKAEQTQAVTLAFWLGDPELADRVLDGIERWRQLQSADGPDSQAAVEQRLEVERLMEEGGGALGQKIAHAQANRWIKLMQARADVSEYQGLLAAYRAAPQLFMERETMKVLRTALANRRKYVVVGIDPDRLNLDVDLQETPSLFDFSDALPRQGEPSQ